MTRRILILGGTAEAAALAAALHGRPGLSVVSSLAGRTASPVLPVGEVRMGGFGGAEGLSQYLCSEDVDAVIDALHPFAARMADNAARACAAAGIPLLRLERPQWEKPPGAQWTEVDGWDQAADLLKPGSTAFLALGRTDLTAFAPLDQVRFLIRSVQAPDILDQFAQARFIAARGPFSLDGERALLRDNAVDIVVCKNSGGSGFAKLQAAAELNLPVIIRRRPLRPPVETVYDIGQAAAWAEAQPTK